ncbi:PREDICTED: aprataxin and PNK-like factor [Cyprinodon variegatus]|uniref:Aprataxin and PNKP like factor n=1 Tax=Cyprinodon variegatus TaxID=28743 RepID=A0A3Q2CX40_CYPVA|nr:PREDICTED: aprataxin and PNK-like factor [Cyprinodon variegatus]
MSGFGLVRVDSGDVVPLPPGETVLGRGPLLGISDTRVSRHHGLLENLNGQLRLKPTHLNPCFILSSLNDDPRPLERGSWHPLQHGDLFSLMPGRFIYRVEAVGGEESTLRNSQNLEEKEEEELPVPTGSIVEACPAVGPQQERISDPNGIQPGTGFKEDNSTRRPRNNKSEESPPAPRRRVLPAWMMAAAAPKVQPAVKKREQASASSATQAPPTISSLPTGVELHEEEEEERPRKKRRKMRGEEEHLPTETEVLSEEPDSRIQTKPSGPGVCSEADHPSMELDDEGPSQTSERISQKEEKLSDRVRTACPYGKDCYRKNPLHFQECSHPGDDDYEEEEEEEDGDRPECPYGTDCYRKNPLHRKEFKHTKKPARSTRNVTKNSPDEDVSEDDDSFINDDSDDLGNDSDYLPPRSDDSEQEDVQRLQKEAKVFLKKGGR